MATQVVTWRDKSGRDLRERGYRIPADLDVGTGTTGLPIVWPSDWDRKRPPVGPGRSSSGRRRNLGLGAMAVSSLEKKMNS